MSRVDDDRKNDGFEYLRKIREELGDDEPETTFEEEMKRTEEKLKPFRPLLTGLRYLTIAGLFHGLFGITLPWLITGWLYFFIGLNLILTAIMAASYLFLFFAIQNPQIHGMLRREDLEGLESNTIYKHPDIYIFQMPLIIMGIYTFGFPMLAFFFGSLVAVERMSQYNFACIMQKFERDDEPPVPE